MKPQFSIVVFIPIICILSSFTANDWVVFKDPKGLFQVQFPNEPTKKTSTLNTQAGSIDVMYYEYSSGAASDSNFKYLISSSTLPRTADVGNDEKKKELMLTNAINGSVRNHKASLISSGKVSLNGHAGMEATAVMKSQAGEIIISMKQYLINGKHIGLMVYTMSNRKNNADIDKFFKSFALIEK